MLAEWVYLNKDINFSSKMDYDFVGEQFSFGGYVNGTIQKVITFDIDDTIGKGAHLGELVDKFIGVFNSRIRPFVNDLINCVKRIVDPEIDESIRKENRKKYCDILRNGRLHRIEFDQASKEAAEQMRLVNNAENLVPLLLRRGYVMRLSTGSPKLAALYLGEKRMNLPVYGVSNLYGVYELIDGTEFEFDPKGYFLDISSGLERKGESMLRFHRLYGSSHHLFVFVTDDFKSKTEREAASIAGLTIYSVERSIFDRLLGFEYPGNIVLACPEAKDNAEILVDKLDRWDRFNVQVWLIDPKSQMALIDIGTKFRDSYENLIKSKIISLRHKAEFLSLARQIQGIIQSTNLKYIKNVDIYDLIFQLERSTDAETDKRVVEDIYSRLKEAIPEIQVPRKFANVFRDVVNEAELFDEVEWMYA
ncbi:MAG: hypothetical protein QW279_15105 [Candidatus Jordarchaeaceae archaeon]